MAIERPYFESVKTITDIHVVAQKPGGTRGGFIGAANDNLFMVKFESGGYSTNYCGKADESSAIECFSAQLIRQIWGNNYAADIRLIPLADSQDQSRFNITLPVKDASATIQKFQKPLKPINESEYHITCYVPYAVISPYEHYDPKGHSPTLFNRSPLERERELTLIGQLLGISDLKRDNTILGNDGNRKLIDCAASFILDTNKKMQDMSFSTESTFTRDIGTTAGAVILEKFINFPENKLIALLDIFKNSGILSNETTDEIRQRVMTSIEQSKAYSINLSSSTSSPSQPHI